MIITIIAILQPLATSKTHKTGGIDSMPAAHFLLDVFVRSHVVDRRPMLNVNM